MGTTRRTTGVGAAPDMGAIKNPSRADAATSSVTMPARLCFPHVKLTISLNLDS